MQVFHLDDPHDERLKPFRDVQNQTTQKAQVVGEADHFVAEGRWVTQRLLESEHAVLGILVQRGCEGEVEQWISQAPSSKKNVPVFVLSKSHIRQIVGFDFHRGVMAIGRRPAIPVWTDGGAAQPSSGSVAVHLEHISDAENVGTILRTAAALDVGPILLGGNTIDPFTRRVIRVSMASVFQQTMVQVPDSKLLIRHLIDQQVRVIASTLDPNAAPLTSFVRDHRPSVLLLGNEALGLPQEIQQLASERYRIPMHPSIDSLNVASAASILLYQLLNAPTSPSNSDSDH